MTSSLKLVKVHQGEGELLLGGEPFPVPVHYQIREYEHTTEESSPETQTPPARSTQGRVTHPEGHRGWHSIVLTPNTQVTLVLNNGHRIDAILESADGWLVGGAIY